jgi:hypothetical protein
MHKAEGFLDEFERGSCVLLDFGELLKALLIRLEWRNVDQKLIKNLQWKSSRKNKIQKTLLSANKR